MALIKCMECGKEISSFAESCPHCGRKVEILQNKYANNRKENISFGRDLGIGIKESLKGLNTMASPKKRKTCVILSSFSFIALIIAVIGGVFESDKIIGFSMIPLFLSGLCQFYVGNFKKGIIYTFTCGIFCIGSLIDLFKLTITRTFRDANGFPIIY